MTIQAAIEQKLAAAFQPAHLQVINESFRHNVPPGSESHFKVTLVSSEFADKRMVARHQLVYKLLDDELKAGVHALALHLYTAEEWQEKEGIEPQSPPCHGGSK